MLAFFYLAAAVLQRRQATWLVAVATVAAFAALRLQDWVDPVVALIVAALALVLWAPFVGSCGVGYSWSRWPVWSASPRSRWRQCQ